MGGLVDRILDPNDFTYRYNTTLTPDEELAFTQWAKENNKLNDAYDYDIRGAWKDITSGKMTFNDRGHLGDRYKKPNHPTFSDESVYHNVDGYSGGKWSTFGNTPIFTPSSRNFLSKEALIDYFKKHEPNAVLLDGR